MFQNVTVLPSDCGAIRPCAGQSWYGTPALSDARRGEERGVSVVRVSIAVDETSALPHAWLPSRHRSALKLSLIIGSAATAWALSGHAVAVPVAAVGLLSITSALADTRTRRIPNALVLTAFIAAVVGGAIVRTADHRPLLELLSSAVAGVVLSGVPLLVVLWLFRPSAIGGGDVKLLFVQGATLGLVAPYAAPVVLLVAAVVSVAETVGLRRTRDLPLGPGLAAGYVAALAFGIAAQQILGGSYA